MSEDTNNMNEDFSMEKPIQSRSLWSKEAEQAVLGAVLLDNDVMDQVCDLLAADDFYLNAHRVIYQAMKDIIERGDQAEPITLYHYLETNNDLESLGGSGYLVKLLKEAPTIANAKHYARLIRDKAVLRELAQQLTKTLESLFEHKQPKGERSVDEFLEEAEHNIFSVRDIRSQHRPSYHEMKSAVWPVVSIIEERMQLKEVMEGIPTGFTNLDRMLFGLRPSELIILAGRPETGKMAFTMNVAVNAAIITNAPVAIFSYQMSKNNMIERLLSVMSDIDVHRLRTGHMQGIEYEDLQHASKTLSKAPIYVSEIPPNFLGGLRFQARRMKREKGIQLIVIDYLQLIRDSDEKTSQGQDLSEVSRSLKRMAYELDVPIMAISQLPCKVDERPSKTPEISDLMEYGHIDRYADLVMLLSHQKFCNDDDPILLGRAKMIIAKHRQGPTGKIPITFKKQFVRLQNHINRSRG